MRPRPKSDGVHQGWGTALKSRWNALVVVATFVLTVVTQFLLPPPAGTDQAPEDTPVWRFGRFVLTLFVGLMLVPVRRWDRRPHTVSWFVAAAAAFVGCIAAFFTYVRYQESWTSKYDGRSVVIGSALTPHGQAYFTREPRPTPEQVLWEHAGKVDDVWTKESVDDRRLALAVAYILALPLFATAMICVVQAIGCQDRS